MFINIDRLTDDILQLSKIGGDATGITRLAFSDEDMEARRWLVTRMEQAGLDVRVDEAGNIRGRLKCNDDTPVVACGSHIDTVNCGGRLDGTLGVLAGLEALRTIEEAEIPVSHPLEVIAFSDEEGRFGGMLGSRVMAGIISQEELDEAIDVNDMHLYDCMKEQGFEPASILKAQEKPESFKAFIELHIEQGPVLDKAQIPIGIVDAITGLFRWKVSIEGQAGHSGTLPMDMRQDAFQGLVAFAAQIENILKKQGTKDSRATIGTVELSPGSPNVVPGGCSFTLEVREKDRRMLDKLDKALHDALIKTTADRSLTVDIKPVSRVEPVACDKTIVSLMRSVARKQGIETLPMVSGASHDAQNLVDITKTGMIFVPSIDGISHSPDENTAVKDIETGANLLLNVLCELAQ